MKTVAKAVNYVTWNRRLLVFTQPASPDAGLQVPAGTVKHGEAPIYAALRETKEETGLERLIVRGKVGETSYDMSPHGRSELQQRHFFHLVYLGKPRLSWVHVERDAENGVVEIPFSFRWVSLDMSIPFLEAGQGTFLPELLLRL